MKSNVLVEVSELDKIMYGWLSQILNYVEKITHLSAIMPPLHVYWSLNKLSWPVQANEQFFILRLDGRQSNFHVRSTKRTSWWLWILLIESPIRNKSNKKNNQNQLYIFKSTNCDLRYLIYCNQITLWKRNK